MLGIGSFLSSVVEMCACCDPRAIPAHEKAIDGGQTKETQKEKNAKHATHRRVDLMEGRQDLSKSKKNTKTQAPQYSSWKREPDPMPGWTFEEQRTLIATSRSLQSERAMLLKHLGTEERAHWEYLRLIARHLPGKSADDCKRCLAHVKKSKIAYFGSSTRSL